MELEVIRKQNISTQIMQKITTKGSISNSINSFLIIMHIRSLGEFDTNCLNDLLNILKNDVDVRNRFVHT